MKKSIAILWLTVVVLVVPHNAYGMHISEGFLAPEWCVAWFVAIIPFLIAGLYSIRKKATADPRVKLYLGIAGGFVFVLSALKLPSFAGSCSHLTGTGLGTVLFGPLAMSIISLIVLIFQALLLAHGGITTLGANVFSMGIAGSLLAFAIFYGGKKLKLPMNSVVFMAAFLGDIFTYIVTSGQLAIAFPAESGGILTSFTKFATMFAVTQLPLAVLEGVVTVYAYNFILKMQYNYEKAS